MFVINLMRLRLFYNFTSYPHRDDKISVVQSCDEYLNRQANYSVFHRPSGKINADSALEFLWQIDEENCKNKDYEELNLKGDISWGAEKQFENEALMAVRTANFLSAFLQVLNST